MKNKVNRPITTLFMLESLDGKISSGSNNNLDVDKDFCKIIGVKEGLHQYYELEKETDVFSLNTGKVMEKIGVNVRKEYPKKIDEVSFVIIDNKPHLNDKGIDYICHWVGRLLLVTTNKNHVAYSLKDKYDNLEILYYDKLDPKVLLEDLYRKYNADRLTIQSGGTLNGLLVRNKLIDFVNIVIAPIIIGGKDVPTLVDGDGITDEKDLFKLLPLQLLECNKLEDSYIQLKYKVL
jgi:2,5-diamino-6-(ribosylamino)-4(3H)-pyrimidinone 5'-phosphate reductase